MDWDKLLGEFRLECGRAKMLGYRGLVMERGLPSGMAFVFEADDIMTGGPMPTYRLGMVHVRFADDGVWLDFIDGNILLAEDKDFGMFSRKVLNAASRYRGYYKHGWGMPGHYWHVLGVDIICECEVSYTEEQYAAVLPGFPYVEEYSARVVGVKAGEILFCYSYLFLEKESRVYGRMDVSWSGDEILLEVHPGAKRGNFGVVRVDTGSGKILNIVGGIEDLWFSTDCNFPVKWSEVLHIE